MGKQIHWPMVIFIDDNNERVSKQLDEVFAIVDSIRAMDLWLFWMNDIRYNLKRINYDEVIMI